MKKNTLMALCLVLALLLILCGCAGEKEEAYRMIQVLEVSGSVSVERASMGALDVYEGMRLESGDKITVGTESWLKIKMDEMNRMSCIRKPAPDIELSFIINAAKFSFGTGNIADKDICPSMIS